MPTAREEGAAVEQSLHDLYEDAPCGLLSTDEAGLVVKVNATFLTWAGRTAQEVLGAPFTDMLTVGSRIFHETRCLPALRLKGELREVSLILRRP